VISAIDHESGAGLNRHCLSLEGTTAASYCCRVSASIFNR
jgi:hypothetical protein